MIDAIFAIAVAVFAYITIYVKSHSEGAIYHNPYDTLYDEETEE